MSAVTFPPASDLPVGIELRLLGGAWLQSADSAPLAVARPIGIASRGWRGWRRRHLAA